MHFLMTDKPHKIWHSETSRHSTTWCTKPTQDACSYSLALSLAITFKSS